MIVDNLSFGETRTKYSAVFSNDFDIMHDNLDVAFPLSATNLILILI